MSSNSSSSTARGASALGFGNGLIEIAALTALIGSTTAESLILGNRGAAGLLWSTMSMFGALSVIKACIAAATPAWLRETFGVKSKETDAALGVALVLNDKLSSSRQRFTGVCGIGCKISISPNENDPMQSEIREVSSHDIYAFDQSSSGVLEIVPEYDADDSFHVYSLSYDSYKSMRSLRNNWRDWSGILASGLKLVEITVLWRQNASVLCLISAGCWMYYLFATVTLQLRGLSREHHEGRKQRRVDIMAAQLPTPVKAGGRPRILLGVPQNVRESKFWQVAWAIGALVSTASVIGVYMMLGSQDLMVFVTWTGFQFFWLMLRSLFYHIAEGTDQISYPIISKQSWKVLNPNQRARVRNLVQALALYQMHIHPRSLYCYEEDERVIREAYNTQLTFPLNEVLAKVRAGAGAGTVDLTVSAVVGDTLLSSVSFVLDRKYTPLDLYDTCVLMLKVDGVDAELSIPAARVMSNNPPARNKNDIEATHDLQLPSKGGSNMGKPYLTWYYWIPCSESGDLWLEMRTDADFRICGNRTAKILTGEQVTRHLMSGELYVSISEVKQVRETVVQSRAAFKALRSLISR